MIRVSGGNNNGERHRRSVRWFDNQKGFGFITPEDGGDDLFVHQSSIRAEGFRSFAADEFVEFDVETDHNGRPKAIEVLDPMVLRFKETAVWAVNLVDVEGLMVAEEVKKSHEL